MIAIGTRIRFTKELSGQPTGDYPAFHFASIGDEGEVMGHNEGDILPYSVKIDSWPNSFKASEDEFEIIESEVTTGVLACRCRPESLCNCPENGE